MTTPSDPTAVQPPTYKEMADRAQAGLDEEARAVAACRAGMKHDHQASIGHDTGSEYGETEPNDGSSPETDLDE